MKQFAIIFVFCILAGITVSSAAQDELYIAGASYGFQYKVTDVWVGDPYNIWIDQTYSSIFEAFFYRKLSDLFQTGFYCDFERGRFDVIGLPEQKAKRIGIGTLWLGHYPERSLQFQLGGYIGYDLVLVDYEDVDNRSGMDYGIIAGPAFEYRNFGFAVHHHAGFAWYPRKDAEPDEFTYANSKFKIKIYYKF